MKHNYQGFTLIELLVVVAIMGILASVGMVSYQGYTWAAKKKAAELSLNSILLANEEYASDSGGYYYITPVSDGSSGEIEENLLDGKEVLPRDNWEFGIEGDESNQTLRIMASHKTKTCTLTLTEKMNLTPSGSDC
jgi:type IV pilus assembly protein PilE